MRIAFELALVPLVLAAGIACAGSEAAKSSAKGAHATAKLAPTKGNEAAGTIAFVADGSRVRVRGEITGLAPGEHGFHVHEKGDCNCPDAACAGGHFNPTGKPHAAPGASERHVGDLGNVTADSSGKATVEIEDGMITLDGGETSIVGKSLVVHAKADDLKSQPSGEAGARVACAVIEAGE